MPIDYGPRVPPIPPGLSAVAIGLLREELMEDTVQAILTLARETAAIGQGGLNVLSFGAKGNGIANDTSAFDAMFAAAEAAKTSTYSPTCYIPDGDYRIDHPFFLISRTTIVGQSREGVNIQWLSGYTGHVFVGIDNRDDFPLCAPRYTTAYGGYALISEFEDLDTDTKWYFDITQYDQCRLSGDFWTMGFYRVSTEDDGDLLYGGAYYGVPSLTPDLPHMFELFLQSGTLKFRFRHGNTYDINTVATASKPTGAIVTGTLHHYEISWDKGAGKLRVFVDGELWTLGARSPPAGDGSGFWHRPWEKIALGSGSPGGYPAEDIVFQYALGATKDFHLSSRVDHTANFTPTEYEPDARCLLSLKFRPQDRFKGMAIGTGYAGTTVVYLYPTCFRTEEHSGIRLFNMRLSNGLGMRFEFASDTTLFNVFGYAHGDGWSFGQNGYFSNMAYCSVVANAGRHGLQLGSLSYGTLLGCTMSGAIPFCSSGANVDLIGCTATVQGPALTGFFMGAGTFKLDLCQVDAENAVQDGFVAPAIFFDSYGFRAVASTFYPPPGKTSEAVLIYNGLAASAYAFESCFFIPTVGSPLFRVIERIDLTRPIICNSPINLNSEDLCADASLVVDLEAYKPHGSATFGAAVDVVPVVFPFELPNANYEIGLTVGFSGAPTDGACIANWSSKLSTGFTINLRDVPGVGEEVTVDWHIVR